jgi:D-3-phosphoglycerate dehydrogenase
MKQVLILQDLGIDAIDFESNLIQNKLHLQSIWGIKSSQLIPEKVEIIITIKEKVDETLLKQFPNTKLIAVAFTGYDVVDINYCSLNNMSVCNVPSYATDAVAELTIGLAISLLRDIPKTNQLIRNGGWNFTTGQELKGKTIGIVGTGTIGLRVAEIFKVFGCELMGWSRTKNPDFIKLGGIYMDDINELCEKVDILSIHTPLNESTKNLIDIAQLKLMKPSSFLINTARGPIVNQEALTKALHNHLIAGAAIDVFDEEPVPQDLALLKTTHSILTPHIAYKTQEALQRRAAITVENIRQFLIGNPINKVN